MRARQQDPGGLIAVAYSFATDESAVDRLGSIAQTFNPYASEFVKIYAPSNPDTVADLGCGPGFSTAMLRSAWPSARLVGLDNAAHSLSSAREHVPDASFICCDLTQTPLPILADVMYARFLLTHLPEPIERINGWLKSLNPGGRLLIDECNDIHPGDDVMAEYLEVTEGLIASAGGCLFVGPGLSAGSYEGKVGLDRVDIIHIPNSIAAGWFTHNVQHVWPSNPYVRQHVDEPTRLSILDRLKSLAATQQSGYSVWYMRRMVLSREMPG